MTQQATGKQCCNGLAHSEVSWFPVSFHDKTTILASIFCLTLLVLRRIVLIKTSIPWDVILSWLKIAYSCPLRFENEEVLVRANEAIENDVAHQVLMAWTCSQERQLTP